MAIPSLRRTCASIGMGGRSGDLPIDTGRDLYSRLVHGNRTSLTIGLVGVALSLILGVVLGRVVETAPTETLFTRPEHPYTAALPDAISPARPQDAEPAQDLTVRRGPKSTETAVRLPVPPPLRPRPGPMPQRAAGIGANRPWASGPLSSLAGVGPEGHRLSPVSRCGIRDFPGGAWYARQDSNLWPSAPEADALSS